MIKRTEWAEWRDGFNQGLDSNSQEKKEKKRERRRERCRRREEDDGNPDRGLSTLKKGSSVLSIYEGVGSTRLSLSMIISV